MRKAVFTFELGPEKNEAVLEALRPESSREIPRASASVRLDGGRLHLEISAEDSASLRAAVNSYLRWVNVAAVAADAGLVAMGRKGAPGGKTASAGKTASDGKTASAGNAAKKTKRPGGKGAAGKMAVRGNEHAKKKKGAPRGRSGRK